MRGVERTRQDLNEREVSNEKRAERNERRLRTKVSRSPTTGRGFERMRGAERTRQDLNARELSNEKRVERNERRLRTKAT